MNLQEVIEALLPFAERVEVCCLEQHLRLPVNTYVDTIAVDGNTVITAGVPHWFDRAVAGTTIHAHEVFFHESEVASVRAALEAQCSQLWCLFDFGYTQAMLDFPEFQPASVLPLWALFQHTRYHNGDPDLIGVFKSEDEAVRACDALQAKHGPTNEDYHAFVAQTAMLERVA